MTEDNATADNESRPAVGAPVDQPVRPTAETRWYCLDRDGVAMLCNDEADARAQVIENDDCWPGRAPHRAALLGDVAALESKSAALAREAHTWWTACRDATGEIERLRGVLLKIEAGEYLHLPTMVRDALGPNVGGNRLAPTQEQR